MGRLVGRITNIKGWSVKHVMEEVPLAQLFLLWTENALSEGNEFDGPSYEEIDSMDEMVEAVKSLRRPSG